ncbi:MAG: 3-hydroxyacyl-CoA dehydrogenase family protein [Candidatus Scatomorpha sp.]|jgi:3-hydroxybutyryl-CoA dehydrogenase
MSINSIGVIGGGTMGRQIALNTAIYGIEARVYCRREAVRDEVTAWMEDYMAGRIKKGRLTEDEASAAKALFYATSDFEAAVKGVDCVIEAVSELEEVKRKTFQQISDAVDESVLIATNSSFMLSSMFVDCVRNPSRLANMHFYNPALVLKFVEVVKGPHTSDETARAMYDFCKRTGKEPILMKKEIPGFAANYILRGLQQKARELVEGGYCSYEDVDKACELGLNHPMGPFRLNDLTGIDISFDIMNEQYQESGIKPPCYDLYKSMVEQGKLGRKTKQGFYDYR